MTLARFVGRSRELQVLDHLVRPACLSPGNVIVVVGRRGVGKSALVQKFRAVELERRGVSGWLLDVAELRSKGSEIGAENAWLSAALSAVEGLKIGVEGGFSIQLPQQGKLVSREADPVDRFLSAVKKCRLSVVKKFLFGPRESFQTLVVENAECFIEWGDSPGGISEVYKMLRKMLDMCVEETSLNLLLVSSNPMIMEWMDSLGCLTGQRCSLFRLDPLGIDDSFKCIMRMCGPLETSQRAEEFSRLWPEIASYAGSFSNMQDVAKMVADAKDLEAAWKARFLDLQAAGANRVNRGFHPELYKWIPLPLRRAPLWTSDQWLELCQRMAASPAGLVSLPELVGDPASSSDLRAISSMVEHGLVDYLPYSSASENTFGFDDVWRWPLIRASSLSELLAMKKLFKESLPEIARVYNS